MEPDNASASSPSVSGGGGVSGYGTAATGSPGENSARYPTLTVDQAAFQRQTAQPVDSSRSVMQWGSGRQIVVPARQIAAPSDASMTSPMAAASPSSPLLAQVGSSPLPSSRGPSPPPTIIGRSISSGREKSEAGDKQPRPFFCYCTIVACVVGLGTAMYETPGVLAPLSINPMIGPSSDALIYVGAKVACLITPPYNQW